MRMPFLYVIILFISINVLAQKTKPDTTFYTSSTRAQQVLGLHESSKATDTILDNAQNYYQMGVLGNMGLPSYSLIANAPKQGTSTFFN